MKPETEEYVRKIWSRILPEYQIMEKYLPGFIDANIATRRSFYPAPGEEDKVALPRKFRELIMIALELGTEHGGGQGTGGMPGVSHSRRAVRESGVTPREISEVVAITTYLCGQPSLVDYGAQCIKAAEEEYLELQKNKKYSEAGGRS